MWHKHMLLCSTQNSPQAGMAVCDACHNMVKVGWKLVWGGPVLPAVLLSREIHWEWLQWKTATQLSLALPQERKQRGDINEKMEMVMASCPKTTKMSDLFLKIKYIWQQQPQSNTSPMPQNRWKFYYRYFKYLHNITCFHSIHLQTGEKEKGWQLEDVTASLVNVHLTKSDHHGSNTAFKYTTLQTLLLLSCLLL